MTGTAVPYVSSTTRRAQAIAGPVLTFFERSGAQVRAAGDDACVFVAGDPQEKAPAPYVEALARAAAPERPDWFAYVQSSPSAQEAAAASLRERLGVPFRAEDVLLTNASIAALAVALRTLLDPGDEVVIVQPPHFSYEMLIAAAGGTAVRVPVDPRSLDLDTSAVARAITDRTRVVLLNTPHNPTGKIFGPGTLTRLAEVLEEASRTRGPITLLSDEAYSRIVFGGARFHSPSAYYPRTIVVYSYGKQLLAPGQRIGYLALHPDMPGRDELRSALMVMQLVTGWAWPNALLQHAIAELERLDVDMAALERRRDRVVTALRDMGYEGVTLPEATFYVMVNSPLPDDDAFCDMLAEDHVFVLPGKLLEMPGTFRISLTGTDAMVERALPRFAAALARARSGDRPHVEAAAPAEDHA
jgi:aspartate aminotransferase